MIAKYKTIKGFPSYKVGSDGTVWSCRKKKWRQLQGMRGTGYVIVRLYSDDGMKDFSVHRLVLEAFVGPCPNGMEACHEDDDPINNRLENLRWDTHKENVQDAIRNGVFKYPKPTHGSEVYGSKLLEFDVLMVRALQTEGCSVKELSADFGVSRSQIKRIVKGTTWKHLLTQNVHKTGKFAGWVENQLKALK